MGPAFVEDLSIGRFHGVGPATEAKMKRLGIHTGRDLKARSLKELQAAFESAAAYYHTIARGIDERPVRAHRIRKSIGAENTFSEDSGAFEVLAERLQPLIDKVWLSCESKGVRGRKVTLKLKFSDFVQITQARSRARPLADREALAEINIGLLRDAYPLRRHVRLLGVPLSGLQHGLTEEAQQLGLAI